MACQFTLWFVWTSVGHGNAWSDGSDLSPGRGGCRNRSFQTVHVCKTEFWVIPEILIGFHFRLGDPTDHNFRPGKLPEEYYIRTGTETSRLLQIDPSRLLTSGLYRHTNRIQLPDQTGSRPWLPTHCLEPVLWRHLPPAILLCSRTDVPSWVMVPLQAREVFQPIIKEI